MPTVSHVPTSTQSYHVTQPADKTYNNHQLSTTITLDSTALPNYPISAFSFEPILDILSRKPPQGFAGDNAEQQIVFVLSSFDAEYPIAVPLVAGALEVVHARHTGEPLHVVGDEKG